MLRTLAKTSGFAVCYMAEASSVYARIIASGVAVTLRQVETMLANMRKAFARYYQFCDEGMSLCIRRGYVEEPLSGRRRWLGHAPELPAVSNFPVQAGAAALMNQKLPQIVEALQPLGARLIAQVHDAGYFEVPAANCQEAIAVGDSVFTRPIRVRDREVVFPADWHVGDRWNEL